MIASFRNRMVVAIFALVPWVASAAPTSEQQKFTLGQYVPHDCWLYIHGVHNPERDFIDAHWAKVFDAFKKSGIGEDIKNLVFSGAPTESRAQVEQGWERAMQLLGGVNWGDLMKREVVFTERLTGFIPEFGLLCRSTPESVDPNMAGLKAILEQLATLSGSMTLTETAHDGVSTWRLAAPDVPFAIFLFHKDDVVGIVMGENLFQDMLDMMSGKKSEGALVQTARFKKAISELPAPEDTLGFFDIKMLMNNLDGIFESAFKKSHAHRKEGSATEGTAAESEEATARRIVGKVVDHLDFFDTFVFVNRTEGLQELTDSAVRIQPECKQKPLCKMFTGQKPFERFDQYVPKEATGFMLWDGLELHELYTAVLDFIKTDVPGGGEALSKWAQIQQDMGFDVEADFFSWWSGECISVDLPAAVKTPFAGADSVLLLRVKDGKLAAAKVNAGIDRVAALAREHNQALIIQDVKEVQAEGFRSVTHPMFAMMGKLVIGVADDQLILSSSAEAINLCLDTSAGKHPSIKENARFKAEGLSPKGSVCSATFTDLSNMGQELSAAFFSLPFVGAFIPDEPDTKPIKAVIGMLSKLIPAIQEINFFSSSATMTEFDGQMWRTRQVVTYKPATPDTAENVAQKP